VRQRFIVVLALLLTWACYGIVAVSLADREASRCHDFGDLAAECSAPFAIFLIVLSLVFLCATSALTFLALRTPPRSDKV